MRNQDLLIYNVREHLIVYVNIMDTSLRYIRSCHREFVSVNPYCFFYAQPIAFFVKMFCYFNNNLNIIVRLYVETFSSNSSIVFHLCVFLICKLPLVKYFVLFVFQQTQLTFVLCAHLPLCLQQSDLMRYTIKATNVFMYFNLTLFQNYI